MKKISLLFLLLTLGACQNNSKICECINLGNKVNTLSARMTGVVADKVAVIKHSYFLLNKTQSDSLVNTQKVDSLKNVITQDSIFVYAKKDSLQAALKERNIECKPYDKLKDDEIQKRAAQCPSLKFEPK